MLLGVGWALPPALAAAAGMEAAKLGLYDIAAGWRGAPGRTGARGAPGPRALWFWCARARVFLDRGIGRIWRIRRADLEKMEASGGLVCAPAPGSLSVCLALQSGPEGVSSLGRLGVCRSKAPGIRPFVPPRPPTRAGRDLAGAPARGARGEELGKVPKGPRWTDTPRPASASLRPLSPEATNPSRCFGAND